MTKLQKIKTTVFTGVVSYSFLPLAVYAALQQFGKEDIGGAFGAIGGVLNTIIGILFVLATVIFLWGVIQFIASSGSEEGRKKAKGIMTWGIIGLAVMAAAWGVANILIDFFVGTGTQGPTFVEPPKP